MTPHDPISPGLDEHPAADQLADFAEGTLPFANEQQVRRHLEVCAECDSLIRDLSSYPTLEPPDETYQVDDEELRATLGALRARSLGASPDDRSSEPNDVPVAAPEPEAPQPEAREWRSPPAAVPVDERSVPFAPQRRWQMLAAAAAVLLALSWGWQRGRGFKKLEAEVTELRQQLAATKDELRQPLANVKVARLLAGDDPLRGSTAPTLSLARTGSTVLIQTLEPLPPGRYTGEIRRPSGEVARRIENLEPQPIGLTFFLPAAALEPGDYRLWLLRDGSEVYPTPFELQVAE